MLISDGSLGSLCVIGTKGVKIIVYLLVHWWALSLTDGVNDLDPLDIWML